MKKQCGFFIIICMAVFMTGCASMPIVRAIRQADFFAVGELLSIMTFLIGGGIMWYCWTQAKEKNRNPWIWLALGFIFGVLGLFVLVYLKKLPKKISE